MSSKSRCCARILLAGLLFASVARAGIDDGWVEHGELPDYGIELIHDAAGAPLLAFGGEVLHFARWDGARWQVEDVDRSTCTAASPSLALDTSGRPAIAYDSARSVLLARWDGADWTIQAAVPDLDSGTNPSLAFDPAGYPCISYSDDNDYKIKLVCSDGSGWRTEVVGSFAGAGSSTLAFDTAGEPLVAYSSGHTGILFLARRTGTAWTVQSLGDWEAALKPALVLDPGGYPVIASLARSGTGCNWLRLARFDGTTWNHETVDGSATSNTGWMPSLALDSSGRPLVSYYDRANQDLRFARFDGAVWTLETVDDSAGDNGYSAIGLDLGGVTRIAHIDREPARDVKLSHRGATSWTSEIVDSSRNVGWNSSVAVDPAGQLLVSYREGYAVLVARFDGTAWSYEPVGTGTTAHGKTAIAVSPGGLPSVAFPDGAGLMLARHDGSAWRQERVDSGADVGEQPSLAIDAAGNPAISFMDEPNVKLKYARHDGLRWSVEAVSAAGSHTGDGSSLLLDAAGHPWISYCDTATAGLKLAHFDGTGWSIETVDPEPERGCRTSLARDASGSLVVAYGMYRPAIELRLARQDGTGWVRETITGDNASEVALALTPAGEALVAYTAGTSWYSVRLAKRDAGVWQTEVLGNPGRYSSLAIDASGESLVTWWDSCHYGLRLGGSARGSLTAYRAQVESLAPGWKSVSLPLSDATDVAGGPFPAAGSASSTLEDPAPPAVPLVLYRALGTGLTAPTNNLRMARSGTGLKLVF